MKNDSEKQEILGQRTFAAGSRKTGVSLHRLFACGRRLEKKIKVVAELRDCHRAQELAGNLPPELAGGLPAELDTGTSAAEPKCGIDSGREGEENIGSVARESVSEEEGIETSELEII